MSKKATGISRFIILGLLIALLLTSTLILAPGVGAASDANKTETDLTIIDDTSAEESDVLTQRAITMDEAKKQAQAAVSEQLASISAVDEDSSDSAFETSSVETYTESATTSDSSAKSTTSNSSSTKSDEKPQSATTAVQTSVSSGYLMAIDNPDPNYSGCSVYLSDYDRDLAERILMGEAGSMSYTGMVLVAQCLRDTYVSGSYSGIADVIYRNGWYGSTSITPSSTCKQVISYVFDQGGSAVQHRIRVFYASNYCTSSWHEAQKYVCSSGYVRFFDL